MKEIENLKMKSFEFEGKIYRAKSKDTLRRDLGIGIHNPIVKLIKRVSGSCEDILPLLEDKSIDLVITSPPYNLGNNHHTGNKHSFAYSDNLPEEIYQSQQISILNYLFFKVKDNGSLFYNHKNRIKNGKSITPYQWLLNTNWFNKQEIIWFNRSQNFDKIRFYPMTERVYWLVKDENVNLINAINHHDLFDWQAEGTDKEHKRSFPEKMPLDIISCFPNSKVVLDCYCGSGTVPKVCEKLGRKWVGIEISEDYCRIAKERIQSEYNQLKMF